MSVLNEVVDDEPEAPAQAPPAPVFKRWGADVWAPVSYLALAVLVLFQLWRDPNGRVLSANDDDHGFFMLMMAHGERVVFHGDNPLVTGRINVPDGMNVMANTSVLLLSVPMALFTHLFGAGFSVVFLLTLGLAGTAYAWYRVLSRHWVRSRVAAWIGGLWCGFCPAMVAHSNGHVNFVSAWLIPFLALQVVRLREPGRVWRGGITLGLLIVAQVFLNEELLLFTAITLGALVLAYGGMNWRDAKRDARHFLPGIAVAALVSGLLLAYPLWVQFTGPQSYHGQPFATDKFVTDLDALWNFARQSIAGNTARARRLSVSATEDDAFFGPVGFLMILVSVVVLRRSRAARATAVAGFVLLVFCLGPHLRINGRTTSIWLPFDLVKHLPVINLVSVTRFAMATAVVAGVLLALATDRIRDWPRKGRIAFQVGLALALVPMTPKPLPIVGGQPLPPFIADGTWKQYVTGDQTLVTVPLPEVTSGRVGMRWAALSHLDYPIPRGYFMGPEDPPDDLTGSWVPPRRFTSTVMRNATQFGTRTQIGPAEREQIQADLSYWKAGVVVLVPDSPHGDLLLAMLTEALGQPQLVGGVDIWPVRSTG